MQQVKQCPQCQKTLSGRFDKRYCSDQCRSQSHNLKRRQNTGEQLILSINTILRKNRTILRQFSPQGKTTTNRELLELAGFDLRHFTHLYRSKNGNIYHFCYDYGYLLLDQGKALIVNWQPYMEKGQLNIG